MTSDRVTELPHKLPHYVALISLLSRSTIIPVPVSVPTPVPTAGKTLSDIPAGLPSKPMTHEEMEVVAEVEPKVIPTVIDSTLSSPARINVATEIVLDLMKALQVSLDERKWRNVRYCVSCQFSASSKNSG